MNKIFDGFRWGLGASLGGALVSWVAYRLSLKRWEAWLKEGEDPEPEPIKKGYTKLEFNN